MRMSYNIKFSCLRRILFEIVSDYKTSDSCNEGYKENIILSIILLLLISTLDLESSLTNISNSFDLLLHLN
jgi:hypothetical protein